MALKIAFERGDSSSARDTIDMTHLFASSGKLGKDETTEIIEGRKIQKDEIILLEKMVDIMDLRKNK